MKYTIKVGINTQQNVNAGQKDKDNNPLPEKIESVRSYNVVTDLRSSGSVELTVDAIKTAMRSKFHIVNATSESIQVKGVEASGSLNDDFGLVYTVTTPYTSGSQA